MNRNLTLSIFATILLSVVFFLPKNTLASDQIILDNSNLSGGLITHYTNANTGYGQTATIGEYCNISKIDFFNYQTILSSASVYVMIYDTPDGNLLYTSDSVLITANPNQYYSIPMDFESTANTNYYFVIFSNKFFRTANTDDNNIASGRAYNYLSSSNSVEYTAVEDLSFIIYTDDTQTCAVCGDGTINGLETCDDGENNGENGYCNEDCTGQTEYCGDEIRQTGELCDDGENNGQLGYCSNDCSYYNLTIDFYPCEIPDNTLIQRFSGCENIYRTSTTTADEVRFFYYDIPVILLITFIAFCLSPILIIVIYIVMKKK